MSRVTVTADGTGTVGVVTDTVSLSVAAETNPATDIATTSATLNGTVDPNGTSILTGQFEYGTSPTLVGATIVTATTPASGTLNGLTAPTAVSYSLTGLSSGTTYYYRVTAGAAQGSILSFTTIAVLAAPTTATTAASSVTETTATLNGTINPNLTPITGIQFVYGTVSNLSSGTTTATVDDGSETAALTAGGSTAQAFSLDVTGLTTSTTYYFKIRACTSALIGTYPNVSCSSFVDGSILNFTPGLLSRTLAIDGGSYAASYTMAATPPTITSTPSAGAGTKSYSSSTTGVCTVDASSGLVAFVSAGTCTIGASIAADGTHGTATAETVSFSVTLAVRTLAIDGGSYSSTYSMTATPPTITSTPSAGAGTKSYSSSTTGVCTVNASSGLVAFVAVGTCTIGASIASDGTYAVASAVAISFSVTAATSPDLSSSVLVDDDADDTVRRSNVVTYTLTITNSGDGDATGVSATAELDADLEDLTVIGMTDCGDPTDESTADVLEVTGIEVAAGTDCVVEYTAEVRSSANRNATIPMSADVSAATEGGGGASPAADTLTVRVPSGSSSPSTPYVPPAVPQPEPQPEPTPEAKPDSKDEPPATDSTDPTESSSDPTSSESSDDIGATASVGFAVECLPPVPPVCDSAAFDLYLVNPDGTERHPGDGFVRVESRADGTARYSFEDKGSDMDFNDFLVDADANDCANVALAAAAIDAGWHHVLRLSYLDILGVARDEVVWQDSHQSIGNPRTFSVRHSTASAEVARP